MTVFLTAVQTYENCRKINAIPSIWSEANG